MSHAPARARCTRDTITGVVLAGGRGARMDGADKGLVPLAGKPLVEHVLARLAPQVSRVVINANRNVDRYAAFGHPVVLDEIGDFAGPLAGVHATLAYVTTRHVVTVPCDVPALPHDLVTRLCAALAASEAAVAVARTGAQAQPVFALYERAAVLASLTAFLRGGGRKVEAWHATLAHVTVDFGDSVAFRNINTPAELAAS